MLATRQEAILKSIIQDYTDTAQPVGSHSVVGRHRLTVSPATVRNEMGDLERAGYITHPHTSAGRIPTEKGWRYYVTHFLEQRPVAKQEQQDLTEAYESGETPEEQVRFLAKKMADLVSTAVFVAFSPHDVYATGFSHLFAQPECTHLDFVRSVSAILDELDVVLPDLFPNVTEIRVLVGRDSPFGEAFGTILAPVAIHTMCIVGCLGPIRMSYAENVARMAYAQGLIGIPSSTPRP